MGGWNSLQWVGHAERTCDRDERQALGPSDHARDGDESRVRARGANDRTRERRNTERAVATARAKEREREDAKREWYVLPVECDERYSYAIRVRIRER